MRKRNFSRPCYVEKLTTKLVYLNPVKNYECGQRTRRRSILNLEKPTSQLKIHCRQESRLDVVTNCYAKIDPGAIDH